MRKLASILFADIAGYTAMMQEDEDRAREILQKFRNSLHKHVPLHSGEIIQFYGDGVLVLFQSSVEATNCAVKLQQEFLTEPNVPVRMGLHSGDVVFEDDNVFGNSVNEASRIESLGIPNSILFSERIKNDIKNHSEFTFVSLGEFEFKSLDRPMEVFALTGQNLAVPEEGKIEGKLKKTASERSIPVFAWLVPIIIVVGLIAWWNGASNSESADNIESKFTKVAVLPFEVKGSPEMAYLGEGLMDVLSNKINGIEGMVSVDPQISAGIFERNDRQHAQAILEPSWEKQNLNYMITGTVVQMGESLKLLGSIKDKNGNEIASIEESAISKDSLFVYVDTFLQKLVSQIFENKEVDFNSYALQSTQDYDALNDFLKAEQARRKGKWELAHNFYKAATEKDSTFALAWFRWANNIGFYDPDRGGPASERYIKRMLNKYKSSLPPIFQNYVEAWNLSTSGKVQQAIRKAKENLETFGDHVDGLYLYGDLLFHCNFLENRSSRESIPIFSRLLEYDENYLEAEYHLLIMALTDKDSAYLRKMISKYPKEDPYEGIVGLARILTEFEVEEFLRDSLSHHMEKYNVAYDFVPTREADTYIKAYKSQLDSLDQATQIAHNNRLSTLELQGKVAQSFHERSNYYLNTYFSFSYSLIEKSFQPFNKNMIDSIISALPTIKGFSESHPWHVAARGIYYAQGGYEEEAKKTLKQLTDFYKKANSPNAKSMFNYLIHRMKLVQARIANDSQGIRSELDSLYTNSIYFENYGAYETFYKGIKHLEAEFLLEQGEYEKAKQIYEILPEVFTSPLIHAPLEFKIAYTDEQLGNIEEAYERYKYFLAVYQDCDEFFQNNVAHAQTFVAQYEFDRNPD
ncbi:MAG: hypothetical protein KJO04_01925 [Bacteroidia bacterium]|nr:hypothetical protein [Bacteroidia bacterium]